MNNWTALASAVMTVPWIWEALTHDCIHIVIRHGYGKARELGHTKAMGQAGTSKVAWA